MVSRHPVRYSRSPASIRRLAPNLGEHTAEVLGLPISTTDESAF
jgi:crotonobetainyl-CoA:carnitine CoA-transferase CaiB-like acyl-CoA transferase